MSLTQGATKRFGRARLALQAISIAVAAVSLPALALETQQESAPGIADGASGSGVSGLFWTVTPPQASDQSKQAASGYLMGTVHIADASYYPLSSAIREAVATMDVLLVELDSSESDQAADMKLYSEFAMLPDGKTINELYSQATVKRLEAAVEGVGVPAANVQRQKPVFTVVTLSVLQAVRQGLSPEFGVDIHLTGEARKRPEVKVKSLETFRGQMELLDKLPTDEASIIGYLDEFEEAASMYGEMGQAWKSGNSGALYQAAIAEPLRESPELAPFYQKLFFDRNKAMATALRQCLSENFRCMLAVGAGHMVGPGGVADLLREQGYTVQQRK